LKAALERLNKGLPKGGNVIGGSVTLLRPCSMIKVKVYNADQEIEIKIVIRASEESLFAIISNAGDESSVLVNKLLKSKDN
jgi:chaperonin GroEL